MTSHTGPSRRAVLRSAAWSAPAIVVLSAAPAMAVSGPAAVSTTVATSRSGSTVTVTVTLTNANTGATGMATLGVAATAILGSVAAGNATITGGTAGWALGTRSGTTFNFSQPAGIPAAATAAGSGAPSILMFTFAVTPQAVTNLATGSLTATPGLATGTPTPGLGTWN